MEKQMSMQDDVYKRILKAQSNFKKSPKDRVTVAYLETRLESLEQLWQQFLKGHQLIMKTFDSETMEKSPYITEDQYDTAMELYIDYKCALKEGLIKLNEANKAETTSNAAVQPQAPKHTQVKLPKIIIPTFSGLYTEWMTFRDLFQSLIHNNNDIDDVQKLHYLKGHLKGEAEQLLRHTAVTHENYEQCWNLLRNRYNNKQYLVNCIFKRFFGQKAIMVESAHAIKELLDITSETINAISSLDIDVKSWDVIIIYIVSQKLDPESRKQWEAKVSENMASDKESLPTLNQFKEFLETRYRSLEFLDNQVASHSKSRYHYYNSNTNVQYKPNSINTLHVIATICVFCKGEHKLVHCKDFRGVDVDTRRTFVQGHGFCFNCLGNNHSVRNCRNNTSCQICHRRHHSLLHSKGVSQPTDSGSVDNQVVSNPKVPQSAEESFESSSIANHFVRGEAHEVLLATALVRGKARNGCEQLLRALIDQGSQASFITESAVQLLGLKRTSAKGVISGLGGESGLVSRSMVELDIGSRLSSGCAFKITAYVLERLTSYVPTTMISITSWPELEHLYLADPEYNTPNKIDILLGAEIYGKIINEGLIKCPSGSPVAQNTALGWILSGQVYPGGKVSCNVVNMHTQVDQLLKSFWEMEAEPSYKQKILSAEEQRCEEIYQSTTARDEDGRYIVKLPFRDPQPACVNGNSREIALRRFLSLEKKLRKDEHLKREYQKIFKEYVDLNHMQEIRHTPGKGNQNYSYLPYHAVVREDKETTKVRIVFDASCKGVNGVSLNDDLMVGPSLQSELRHIIMRWRVHLICFAADIIKMYRQVKVDEEDANYQRILWRENPCDDFKEYKLLRVTFGTSSAPYLAVKSLMQVAKDEGHNYPLAVERVERDFYMDDLMSGCEHEDEAIEIYKQITALLLKGGFELQKWTSNSESMIERIRQEQAGKEVEKAIIVKLETTNKILGLTWSRETDEFLYSVQLPPISTPVTKRKVISDISKLYDPQGWIAPSVIKAKIFIQKLWLAGIDWDEEVPPVLLEEWTEFRESLIQLTNFRLKRWMNFKADVKLVELHGFSDASTAAFGAVVYARIMDAMGNIHVSLVTAKTRVAPIKQLSIPRLELNGAVLLAKLLVEVSEVLKIPKTNIHAWTDSEVVLAWLSCHPSKWKTFIGNRVSEILTVTDRKQWSHVKSEHNPADYASRGLSAAELVSCELWLRGPSWLKERNINYTNPKGITTNLEERIVKTHLAVNQDESVVANETCSRFSSLKRMLRVLAYCRRFLKGKRQSHTYLLKTEIEDTLVMVIKIFQATAYSDEIERIEQGKPIVKKGIITSLNPELDKQGLLRVGGRLHFADIDWNQKHPIILPKSCHLTDLIVSEAHHSTLHGGPQLMINFIRAKYWIFGLKNLVKFHVKKCVICVRHAALHKPQLMGQLPSPRVTVSRAFLRSGVDYAGPIQIRVSKGRGNRSYKGYICLFICLATRGIHLEAVSDLTSEGFLAAFKRFVARRGHCSELYSDNGTNFVGAARELAQMFQNEQSGIIPEIGNWLATNGTQWHFIPPQAPNFGGLWEAGIKSCKFHLKRVIGNSTLTFEEITTVLTQVESCLNSRPISYIEDQGDPMPLTPGHFLVGEPLILVPDNNYEHTTVSSLRRWQLCQRMLQDFWRRWSQEYLTRFLQRHKWSQLSLEPKVNDVVLVKELDLPPARWLLGKIVEKHPGLDGVTRVVTLRCKNSLIKRPVSKVIVLPVAD